MWRRKEDLVLLMSDRLLDPRKFLMLRVNAHLSLIVLNGPASVAISKATGPVGELRVLVLLRVPWDLLTHARPRHVSVNTAPGQATMCRRIQDTQAGERDG